MSTGKIVLLVIYAILIALALTQGGTAAGVWVLWIIGSLVVVHGIEVAVFYNVCKEAGGSLAGHVLSVFLFGVLHVNEIKAAQGKS